MVFPTAKQIIEHYKLENQTIVEYPASSELAENVGTDYYVMAKCRQGKTPQKVDKGLAQGLINMCTTRVLMNLLQEMRSLSMIQTTPSRVGTDAQEERLLYSECKKYFGDLCLVLVPRDPDVSARCTCELFSKCAECPHVLALLELKQRTSLLATPLPLGVGGRAGTAPKRKQPTSALETQEQVNAKADARIVKGTPPSRGGAEAAGEQPLSVALSGLSKGKAKSLAGAPRKKQRVAAVPSFGEAEEVNSPVTEAEQGGAVRVPDSSPELASATLPLRGGHKRCLNVAQGLETACAELAVASDREGLEVMFLLFGTEETSQTPACATHLVLVDHNGTEGSCSATEEGSIALTMWQQTQADLVQLGWVHSHHGLSQQPSAADLTQQVELQTLAPNSVMVVLKPGCSAQAWAIPRGIHADLRAGGVDSSFPATESLESVELCPRSSGPLVEVVIKGRLLDLAAACGACLGLEEDGEHTKVPGACSKAQVSVAVSPPSRGGPEAAGERTPPSRGGAEAAAELPPPSRSGSAGKQREEPQLPLKRRLTRTLSTVEPPRHQPLETRVREVRRVASDSASLSVPEPARVSSVDVHNETMLMSFFRKTVIKQKGTILLKDVLMKTPLPLGAQTIEQVYKSWTASMKSLKEKNKIQLTKGDRSDISSWKVHVLP